MFRIVLLNIGGTFFNNKIVFCRSVINPDGRIEDDLERSILLTKPGSCA